MANPYAPGPLAGGAEALVGALLGGDRAQQAGHDQEYSRLMGIQSSEAGLDHKITQALMERDKRRGLQEEAPAAISAYMGDNKVGAGLMTALLHAGQLQNIEHAQKFSMRDQLPAAFEADGLTHANALAAALQGKPIESIDIDGDHVVMGKYGAEPVLDLTKLGEAKVASEHAQADQREASADASHARADRTRAMPLTSGGKGSGKGSTALGDEPGDGSNPPPAAVEDLFQNHDVLKGPFIRKYGAQKYAAVMRFRDKWAAQHRLAVKESTDPLRKKVADKGKK